MRVVADTNVIVSAVIAGGKPRKLLGTFLQGELELVLSPEIIDEIVDVLERPKFQLDEEEIHRIVGALIQTAHIVELESDHRVIAEDPDDDKFLNTAIDGRADAIVSGDSHLLDLNTFQGVTILSVAEMLKQ